MTTPENAHTWEPTTNTLAVWKCGRCGAVVFSPHRRPIEGCKPKDARIEPTWCVHILGPDDVLVQPDRATAVREAQAVNTWVASQSDDDLNDLMNPTIWAVVTTLEARP